MVNFAHIYQDCLIKVRVNFAHIYQDCLFKVMVNFAHKYQDCLIKVHGELCSYLPRLSH